jgi:glutaredoxin
MYGAFRSSEGYAERALFVIDKQGVIRYVDVHDIDLQPDNDVLFAELARLEPALAAKFHIVNAPPSPEPKADVVVYCTSWCPDCRRARAYLAEKGIQYIEVDINRDRAAAMRVRGWAKGNETTPTFNIRGNIIVGFNVSEINRALGIW